MRCAIVSSFMAKAALLALLLWLCAILSRSVGVRVFAIAFGHEEAVLKPSGSLFLASVNDAYVCE
jgi:hypothetical protein